MEGKAPQIAGIARTRTDDGDVGDDARSRRSPATMFAMKAVICEAYGGPEVLELTDVDPPQLGPNGVLVRVHASSVNPVDWKLRKGMLSALWKLRFPVIWGCDLSGVVEQT